MQVDNEQENSKTDNVGHSPSAGRTHSPHQLSRSPSISSPLNPHAHSHLATGEAAMDPQSASPSSAAIPPASPTRRSSSNLTSLLSHAASAAEARAVSSRQDSLELDSLIDPSERLRFFRCIDNDLLPALIAPAERAKAVKVMETVLLLCENALEKGLGEAGDEKYLKVKLSNKTIRDKLDLDGHASKKGAGAPSMDYLHLCGWKIKVESFQEYAYLPTSPTSKTLADLRTGTDILRSRVERERETSQRTAERKAAAKEAEGSRVKNALRDIKEDRERVKAQKERERVAREALAARSQQQQHQQVTSPTSPASRSVGTSYLATPTSPKPSEAS